MSLHVARLLAPVTRRLDQAQDRLTWVPAWNYSSYRSRMSRHLDRMLKLR